MKNLEHEKAVIQALFMLISEHVKEYLDLGIINDKQYKEIMNHEVDEMDYRIKIMSDWLD